MDELGPTGSLPLATLLTLDKEDANKGIDHAAFEIPVVGVHTLGPFKQRKVVLGFRPSEVKTSFSLVLVKNNLTFFEKVLLEGPVGHGTFTFPKVCHPL